MRAAWRAAREPARQRAAAARRRGAGTQGRALLERREPRSVRPAPGLALPGDPAPGCLGGGGRKRRHPHRRARQRHLAAPGPGCAVGRRLRCGVPLGVGAGHAALPQRDTAGLLQPWSARRRHDRRGSQQRSGRRWGVSGLQALAGAHSRHGHARGVPGVVLLAVRLPRCRDARCHHACGWPALGRSGSVAGSPGRCDQHQPRPAHAAAQRALSC